MPAPKGPVPPPIAFDDDDGEHTQLSPPPDFIPAHQAPSAPGAISLGDDDDEERTTIDKRPGR